MNANPPESSDLRILRRLVASVPGVVWAVDPDRKTVFVSEGTDRQYGLPASHFIGYNTSRFRAIVHPDDLEIFDASVAAHQDGPRDHECRIIRSDGEIRWLYNRSFPVFAPDGALELVVGTSIDVTAQKRAERRFRDLVEQMPLAMYLALRTPEIPPIYANPQIEELTGYTPEEWLTARPFWRIIDPRDLHEAQRAGAHLLESDEAICTTYRMKRKDGRMIWVQEQSVAVPDEAGEVALVQGFLLDVTETVQVTEELRQSESRSRAFIETAWDGIITHVDGVIVDVQGNLGRLIDRDPETLIGTSIVSLAPESQHQRVIERLQTGATGVTEFEILRSDGSVVPIEIVSRDAEFDGRPARQVGIRDISRRKQAEAALAEAEIRARHAQRLEAVGRLAGGIAHDFNNLLMAISGYADLIISALPEGTPREDAEEIRSTATRGAELTRQLLAFSRRQVMERQPLLLSTVVKDAVALLERLVGEDVAIVTRLDPDLRAILADHSELEQVLANLVVNARDAMPAGGDIVIETRTAIVPPDVDGSMAPGRYAVLSVADSGTGMDPETEARIFEPYFTTKEQGKGTGLGLATVYGIVGQFGGTIEVCSAPGQGTTFTISFPTTDEAPPARDETTTHAIEQRLGAGERVLLVEDQESVRRILKKLVQDLGYAVDVADGGEAALRLLEGEEPYALLVTDVLMPHMDGPELVERARRLRPELAVLYVSGYTTDELLEPGGLPLRTAFLTKPFTRATLAAEIYSVIHHS